MMNNLEGGPVELPPDAEEVVSPELRDFRGVITALKADPTKRTPNLDKVDPDSLKEADQEMYNKFNALLEQAKAGTLAEEEKNSFLDNFGLYYTYAKMEGNTREWFAGYLANRAMELEG